eukprot:TRINITY_DN10728_c0_g1_i1.p1 TRINITY_DN10728_c0_g1~~TRINITY_DN10728_c0_g1_i1.p1  ORF type:complete len:618 (+),score=126.72 TRINITY_DN10728_c0_g1_i1:3-1856(+)
MKKLVQSDNRDSAGLGRSMLWVCVPVILLMVLSYYGEQFEKPNAIELAGQDHFQVMGVAKTVTAKDLKKKFHALARKWHPDKNPGCEDCKARMQSITKAYEVLSDPQEKAAFLANTQKFASIDSETQDIDEEFYYETVLQSEDPWLVQVYADWSYGSAKTQPIWERAATSFEGAVHMGRIDFSRNRIFADKIMHGGTGLPYVFAVFRNSTAELLSAPGVLPTRASLGATVVDAVSQSVPLNEPNEDQSCDSRRVRITLVANQKSTAKFYLHTLKHKFEQDCHLFAMEPSHPRAQNLVEPGFNAPYLLVEQPCSGGSAVIKGPFPNPKALHATLAQHCSPKAIPTSLSASNSRMLCATGCVGTADPDSAALRAWLAQSKEDINSVYANPKEQPELAKFLPTSTTVFGLIDADGETRVSVHDGSESLEDFVKSVADGSGEFKPIRLQGHVLDAETTSSRLRKKLIKFLSSPNVMVVMILVGLLVFLWAVLTAAQSQKIGRFPVKFMRNILTHWIKVYENTPPPAKGKKKKVPNARPVPDQVQEVYDAFLEGDEDSLTVASLVRMAKRCKVAIDEELGADMLEAAGESEGSLGVSAFNAIVETEIEESESDEADCCGDDY